MHTFTAGVTLKTTGAQAVTATDSSTGSITGSASVMVGAAAAAGAGPASDNPSLSSTPAPLDSGSGLTTAGLPVAALDQVLSGWDRSDADLAGRVPTSGKSLVLTVAVAPRPAVVPIAQGMLVPSLFADSTPPIRKKLLW